MAVPVISEEMKKKILAEDERIRGLNSKKTSEDRERVDTPTRNLEALLEQNTTRTSELQDQTSALVNQNDYLNDMAELGYVQRKQREAQNAGRLFTLQDADQARKEFRQNESEMSRRLTSSPYEDRSYKTSQVPIESQTVRTNVDLGGALSRQTSNPLPVQRQKLEVKIPNDPVEEAAFKAARVYNDYLLKNDSTYASIPIEKRDAALLERMTNLQSTLEGKGKLIPPSQQELEDLSDPLIDGGSLGRKITKGNIPDLDEGQMLFLNHLRANLIDQKTKELLAQGDSNAGVNAVAWVDKEIGPQQEWMTVEGRKRMASREPVYQGAFGIGTNTYPSGTTVENTPAYALRLLSGPSNFVAGAVSSLAADALPEFAKQRRQSEMAPTAAVPGEVPGYRLTKQPTTIQSAFIDEDTALPNTLGRAIIRGADSIAKNRGFAEEVYDLTDTYSDNEYLKKAGFVAGLVGDIAMPIIPGAGAGKAIVKTATNAGDLAKVLKGTEGLVDTAKTIAKDSDLLAEGAKLAGREWINDGFMLKNLARATGHTIEAGDVRLVAANMVRDTVKRELAAENVINLGMRENQVALRELQATLGSEDALYKQALRVAEQGEGEVFRMLNNLPSRIPASLGEELADGLKIISDYDRVGSAALKGSKVSYEDLVRWTRTAIDASPQLRALVKDVRGFDNILRTVNGKLLGKRMLYEAMVADKAAQHAAKVINTGPGALYLLTGKTAVASKEAAQKIFEAAKNTPVGQALAKGTIIPEELKTASGSKKVISGLPTTSKISIPVELRTTLQSYVDGLRRTSRFDQQTLTNISEEIGSGIISTQTARALMNLQIDDVARQLYKGKIVALGGKALEKLPNEIAIPSNLRMGLIRRLIQKDTNQEGRLSVAANKTLEKIKQEVSAMNETLGLKLKALMDGKIPGLRELYGLPATGKISEQDAFLALIFRHPNRPFAETGVLVNIEKNAHELAFANERNAEIVARKLGELVLSPRAVQAKGAKGGARKLGSLSEEIAELPDEVRRAWTERTEMLARSLNTEDFPTAISQVADYLDDLSERIMKGQNIAVVSKDNMEELLSALYFELEKGKIIDYHTGNLVDSLAVKINDYLLHPLNLEMQKLYNSVGRIDPLADIKISSPDQIANQLVKARVSQLTKANLGMMEDTYDDFLDALSEISPELRTVWDKLYDATARPVAEMTSREAKAYEEANRLLLTINQIGEDVAKQQRLTDNLTLDPLKGLAELVRSDTPYSNLMMTMAEKNELAKAIGNDKNLNRYKEALDAIQVGGVKGGAAYAARKTANLIKNLQYAMMLSIRPRFHGMNFLTAPSIMLATLGGTETLEALYNSFVKGAQLSWYSHGDDFSRLGKKARNLIGAESDVSNALSLGRIAITTPSGVSYTWRDLADIARQEGITRTQLSTEVGRDVIESNAEKLMLDFVKDAPVSYWERMKAVLQNNPLSKAGGKGIDLLARVRDYANDFAEMSDGAFRMSVFMNSLEKGEDVSQAVQKARAALYDYGKLTEWEKKHISSWFAFYSFTRASVASAITGLLDNPDRYAALTKMSKGMNIYGDSEEKPRSLFYEPEYLRSKPLMAIYNGINKERYGEYAPGLPPLDAVILLANVLAPLLERPSQGYQDNGVSGLASGLIKGAAEGAVSVARGLPERANPALRVAAGWDGDTEKMILEQGYIDPRHIAWLKATGQWDRFVANIGLPQQKPAEAGETSWNGYVYTWKNPNTGVVDEVAARNYLNLLRTTSFLIGSDTVLKDAAPLVARWDEEIDAPWNYTPEELEELKTRGINPDKRGIDLTTNIWEQLGLVTQSRLPTTTETANAQIQKENRRLKGSSPDNTNISY